jgi:predicted membrane protein
MNNWNDDKWSTYITSITISGAMIGALFSGNFTKYGKKRMI